jgi:hypothetical protein
MLFLERLAEEKIRQAIARGELSNLKGSGKPIPEDENIKLVAPEMRLAYRILKNAGYVPEEVGLRREIEDLRQLLNASDIDNEVSGQAARLRVLIQRLGEIRGGNLAVQNQYFSNMARQLAGKRKESID